MMRLGLVCVGLGVFVVLSFPGCSSDSKKRSEQDMIMVDRKSDRQVVVEFDGACAMAMADGKYNIGEDKFVLQHDGKTYYFSSEAAKQKFEKNLTGNVKRAQQNWINRSYAS